MKDDFLAKFLENTARAKLLRALVFNASEAFTVAQLAKRAGVATDSAVKEIKALQDLDIIKKGKFTITLANGSKRQVGGRQKEPTWMLNEKFKHLRALTSFVHASSPPQYGKLMGALRKSGRITAVIVSGAFMGDPTRPADLVVAADGLNESRLEKVIRTIEPQFGREIRYAAFSTPEFRYRLTIQDRLIRDTIDFPHIVLLDKTRLL